jgi:hypothetical protein
LSLITGSESRSMIRTARGSLVAIGHFAATGDPPSAALRVS